METFTHKCIRPGCDVKYQSLDLDPYYCENCYKQSKEMAKQIDVKLASVPRKPVKSELQIFDEIAKAKGTKFVNIKDLGIKL